MPFFRPNPALIRFSGILIILFLLSPLLLAEPFRLLAIGDSLSEEYRFEVPFSAPDSKPTSANTQNWVELLNTHRADSFTMGPYKSTMGDYLDLRNAGYEYNYGIPAFEASRWAKILYKKYSVSDLLKPENLILWNTREELKGDLSAVDAVLIFLGGNDLSLVHDDEKHDEIRVDLGKIHDYVRSKAPANLPIIVATVPDVGATPKEQANNNVIATPEGAAAARQRVATLNNNIIADFSARPHTYIAHIHTLTDRVFDQDPFHLNGTEFIFQPDSENPPLHIFCKDGFHPATAAQALIANEILKAINQFSETEIPLYTNREILSEILNLNPDQPYLDWAETAGEMLDDPDQDHLPNLLEFLLDSNPTQPNPAFHFLPDGSATLTPSPQALRFAELSILQSTTLQDDWSPVPQANIQPQPNGALKIIPTAPKLFYKLQASPRP